MTTVALFSARSPVRRRPQERQPQSAPTDAAVLAFRPRNASGVAPSVPVAAPRRAPDSDQALICAVAAGSQGAMRTLFLRHHTRVFRFLARMVHDEALAEDLTSEVFLGMWRQAARFEGRSSVTTWMLGIARHKALTALEARPLCHDDEVMLGVVDPRPGPAGELEARDDHVLLRRCVAALSREHQQIIDLAYFREKSMKEIATLLGIRLNTVKTRMFHARKRLAALVAAAAVT
jgi:RNA polymerase sigma-70 factor (ECF subfamily)